MTVKIDQSEFEVAGEKWVYFPREEFKDCAVVELDYGEWIFKRNGAISKGPFKDILNEIVNHVVAVQKSKCVCGDCT